VGKTHNQAGFITSHGKVKKKRKQCRKPSISLIRRWDDDGMNHLESLETEKKDQVLAYEKTKAGGLGLKIPHHCRIVPGSEFEEKAQDLAWLTAYRPPGTRSRRTGVPAGGKTKGGEVSLYWGTR